MFTKIARVTIIAASLLLVMSRMLPSARSALAAKAAPGASVDILFSQLQQRRV